MTVLIAFDDLYLLRIAARRWAKEHLDNPNSARVLGAVDRVHPSVEWQLTEQEISERKDLRRLSLDACN